MPRPTAPCTPAPNLRPAQLPPWAPATPEPAPSKDRQVRPFAPFRATQPEAPSRTPGRPPKGHIPTADQPDFPPSCHAAPPLASSHEAQQGGAATGLRATQLCPTQVSGPQSTDIAWLQGTPSPPAQNQGPSHPRPLQSAQPSLLLCREGLVARPSASCSLCSRAASALQASAGHGRAPACNSHTGCPQYPW